MDVPVLNHLESFTKWFQKDFDDLADPDTILFLWIIMLHLSRNFLYSKTQKAYN